VIRAAIANILAASHATFQQLTPLLQQLSSPQQTEFIALVQQALQQQSLSTQAERQLRRRLQTQLQAQGIAEADQIAIAFSLLRLEDFSPYLSLVRDRHAVAMLETAYNLVLQHQSAVSIQQEVDRAAKIVFALKVYTYQNSAEERSRVDITEGIEVALTLYQSRLKQGVEVIRRYDPARPELLCNPDELTQVWVNLIDNAIHAMGQQGTLEIAVTTEGDRLMVTISDSGTGISAEHQACIFDPFFTTKARGEGSGLGLDIVRQIVQKHGGKIQVKSQPGHTTFTISFPLQIP
jgi:two-component system NtrC family sensor kinase